jgi:tripartite-type tricarboxylate transporter receptor subunit TctC
MISLNRYIPGALAIAGAALFITAPAQADPIADFYKGKKINAISGGGAGGGFSFNARVLGRHIVRHIPGNPEWVVTAMPGAGGARSMKYINNAAAQNGTVVGVVLPPSILSPLLRKKIGYDSAKFHWLGSITPMAQVVSVWHTHGVKSLDDAKKREVILGTSSKLSSGYLIPALVNALAGTKFKVISGYRGGDRQNNAMQKGEIQGRGSFYNSYKVTKPHWLKEKTIIHLVQLGPFIKDLPNVPRIRDLAKTDEERRIAQFLQIGAQVGHGFYVSPNVPRARVAALRAAFDATMKDPAYLAEAKKRNLIVDPISGKDLQRAIIAAMATPQPVIDKFKQMVKLDTIKLKKAKKKKK